MNGELAETICLAAHASEWLRADTTEPPSLEGNSTFQYVGSLRFNYEHSLHARIEATDVGSWCLQLRERGVERVWLIKIPPSGPLADRIAASFAGGGTWAMLATAGDRQELWRGAWLVGNRDAPNKKIWAVTHSGAPIAGIEVRTPSITTVQEALLRALDGAREFAAEQDLEMWADWFSSAMAEADADAPTPRFHADMLPMTGYTNEARRLLAVAVGSWVFGGMGSWNDLGFDEPYATRYDELSAQLYGSMMAAFLACVNSPLGS